MKATEQCFLVLLFRRDKVVLTFESINKTLKCDHSNESFELYIPMMLFVIAVQDGSNI